MRKIFLSLLIILLPVYILAQQDIVWEKINGPLYPATPYSFLITSNGTQFVGTDETGLFRSTDNGQTWELKNDNLSGSRITCLAEAPNGWIYAGNAWGNVCLYRSQDNGESWQVVNQDDPEVRSIKFNSNGHIYVGASNGFYRSTNNGASWTLNNNGLIGVGITAIEVVFDSIIYVATEQGIHKTTDEGNNWVPKNLGLVPVGQYIPTNSIIWRHDTLYTNTTTAVYYSTNYGDQWIQRSTYPSIEHLQIDNNDVFYLQIDFQKKLLRSFDYGSTWEVAYTFPDWFMYYKVDNDKIYASVYSEGLFTSNDSGSTFQEYFIQPFLQPEISFLKIIDDTLWLAGTYGFGVFSSNDQGANWKEKGPLKMGASHFQINSLNEIFVNCNNNIYKSTDYGNSWDLIPPPTFFFNNILSTITLSYSDEIFTAYYDGGIAKLNNDNSWDSLAFFYTQGGSTHIVSIIIDIYNDAYLSVIHRTLSGYYYKTYKEIDNFSTFQLIFNQASELSYNDSGYVFFANSSMYRTTDRGNTIEEINSGITNLNASSINVIDFDEVYIGDHNKLYISTNNGEQWFVILGPAEANGIHSIEKVSDGYLIVASKNGIYRNTTVVSVHDKQDVYNTASKFSLSQNYPNPFNPVTKIKYTIPQTVNPLPGGARGGFTTLKVYDILGREIATLVNEQKPAGEYEVEFNGTDLPSGIYFYQLKAGEYRETRKMVLVK